MTGEIPEKGILAQPFASLYRGIRRNFPGHERAFIGIVRNDNMVLTGFTPPYTPTGHSSLVDARDGANSSRLSATE